MKNTDNPDLNDLELTGERPGRSGVVRGRKYGDTGFSRRFILMGLYLALLFPLVLVRSPQFKYYFGLDIGETWIRLGVLGFIAIVGCVLIDFGIKLTFGSDWIFGVTMFFVIINLVFLGSCSPGSAEKWDQGIDWLEAMNWSIVIVYFLGLFIVDIVLVVGRVAKGLLKGNK